jgi:protein-S-isoprenylcysteine O-methyltransferase Ste14
MALLDQTVGCKCPLMMQAFYDHAITTLWLAWLIYWCVAAIGTKRTSRQESTRSRLMHIVPLAVGVGLLLPTHFVDGWPAVRFLPRALVWFWIGFVLVASGLGFSVLARVWLGGNWSGTVTLKQDHELIRSGPYRWVRHPIYTGLLAALLGSVIALGERRGLVGLALIIIFQLPTISAPMMAPNLMSVRRDSPRHMTVLPGGGSLARAR